MKYERTYWEDSPSSTTPLSAENLNKIETGILNATEAITQLESDLAKKADNATTVAGYGITDTYTKTETDEALLKKLDDSSGVIKSNHIANGAVTAIKIANNAISGSQVVAGAISYEKLSADLKNTLAQKAEKSELDLYEKTENKVYTENDITDSDINYPSISYLNDYYYNFSETQELLDEKYDGSNIETGKGVFSIGSVSNYVNSANFEYQKIGEWVDIHIYVDFKAFTPSGSLQSFTLTGLPFVCKNSVTPREMCVTTSKKQMIWGIVSGSASLTLLLFNSTAFSENEKLSFSLRYKIA